MSRFFTGVLLVLVVLVINTVAAMIQNDTATGPTIAGCNSSNNATTCANVGKTTFLASLLTVTVSGISGAPLLYNVLHVLIFGILLIAGFVLIVISFIPTLGQ